jgi:hypothetical protein
MATFTGQSSSNAYITISLTVEQTSQSIENNTSTISYSLAISKSSKATQPTYGTCSYTFYINGAAIKSGGAGIITRVEANGTTTLLTGSQVINHSYDGSCSITVTGAISGKIVASCSGNFSLKTIPRASSVSCASDFTIGSKGTIINISSFSSSFTHKLSYAYGNTQGTIGTVAAGKNTYDEWAPPMSFCSQTPSAVRGVGSIQCDTYSGSTKIGTSSCLFYTNVPASVKATISGFSIEDTNEAVTKLNTGYVANQSQIKISLSSSDVSTTAAYGATISSWSVTMGGETKSQTYGTNNSLTFFPLSQTSLSAIVTITDTRGRTSSCTKTISQLEYSPPCISFFAVQRCSDSEGDVLAEGGAFLKFTYSYKASPLNKKNSLNIKIFHKKHSSNTWDATPLRENSGVTSYEGENVKYVYDDSSSSKYDSNYQRDFRLCVIDSFSDTDYDVFLSSADVVLDFRSDGKGVSIGKVAEMPESASPSFEVAWATTISGQDANLDGVGLQVDKGSILATGSDNSGVSIETKKIKATAIDCSTGDVSAQSLTINGADVTDYVVAEGHTDSTWKWRKWNSGIAELWDYWTINTYKNANVLVRTVSFPFTLTLVDSAVATIIETDNSNKDLYKTVKPVAGTSAVAIWVHSPAGGYSSGSTQKVAIIIRGRWK